MATTKELETELANLRGELNRLERELGPRKVFTADDQIFLTWVLGFTAGANLERDAERANAFLRGVGSWSRRWLRLPCHP